MHIEQDQNCKLFYRAVLKLSRDEVAILQAAEDICSNAAKAMGEDPHDGTFADAKFYLGVAITGLTK